MAFRLTVIVLIAFGVALVGSQAAQARVRPAVSLKVSALEADLGEKLVFSGRVRPNRTGETVFIQEASHGQLRDIASGSLKPGSRFLIRASLRVAGVLRLRAVFAGDSATRQGRSPPRQINVLPVPVGIHKIKHVVVIMQENRSFDEYFGTYPGADGIPPGVCVPDPVNGGCIAPYHDPTDSNKGGPHESAAFEGDLNGGATNTRTEAISPITGPMQNTLSSRTTFSSRPRAGVCLLIYFWSRSGRRPAPCPPIPIAALIQSTALAFRAPTLKILWRVPSQTSPGLRSPISSTMAA
jgi:hypothetical protein